MPTFLSLTPTFWLNLDNITTVRFEYDAYRVTFLGEHGMQTLDREAGAALAAYLRQTTTPPAPPGGAETGA